MSAQNLIDCLMQHAEQSPHTALFTAGPRAISFADMNRKTNQLANALKSLGVGPQDRVALLSKSQIDSALLIFACMKIGAVGMPINWRFSVDEVRFVLEDQPAKRADHRHGVSGSCRCPQHLGRAAHFYDRWHQPQPATA